jgi:acetate kinase
LVLARSERSSSSAGIDVTLRVLVVNAGSSSVKLTLLDGDDMTIDARELKAPRARVDSEELRTALDSSLGEADAIGHRIVHGGERFRQAVRIDTAVEEALRELVDLAPLHQPKSLAALDAVTHALPGLPAVACFDTAFHTTLPAAASTYALPTEWRERWGLRRYGFHGLSHAWVARRTPELLERDASGLRIVSCHLGAGASLCAINDGRSLDTTMGFTPLDGLVMATRSGSVDPGMLLWLLEHERLSTAELADTLEHRSGLLGLCGTADMRELLIHAHAGDRQAQLALDVYIHRLRAGIASMAAALGGIDVLAFTGGVGEHAPGVRSQTAAGLAFLGVSLDDARNRDAATDAEIGVDGATVRALVLTAREDIEIAQQVRALLVQ